jgi:hypothetical protein
MLSAADNGAIGVPFLTDEISNDFHIAAMIAAAEYRADSLIYRVNSPKAISGGILACPEIGFTAVLSMSSL